MKRQIYKLYDLGLGLLQLVRVVSTGPLQKLSNILQKVYFNQQLKYSEICLVKSQGVPAVDKLGIFFFVEPLIHLKLSMTPLVPILKPSVCKLSSRMTKLFN